MQGAAASSKLSLLAVAVLLLGLAGAAHGRRRLVSSHDGELCKKMTLYFHDLIYDGGASLANATSAAATKPTRLSTSVVKNGTQFGSLVVFDDPVTEGRALPAAGEEPAARAQGLYVYDSKAAAYTSMFAFSIVFNSTAHKGTLNLMGADPPSEKKRDLSVVGGTGDFFMARGIATLATDDLEGSAYFRLQMEIKLYECYA